LADAPLLSRKETRIPVKLFVNLHSPDNPTFEVASTIDISCHGARVVTKTFWKPNQHLSVRSIRGNLSREPVSFIVRAIRMIPL